jgi:hypothetical protein
MAIPPPNNRLIINRFTVHAELAFPVRTARYFTLTETSQGAIVPIFEQRLWTIKKIRFKILLSFIASHLPDFYLPAIPISRCASAVQSPSPASHESLKTLNS